MTLKTQYNIGDTINLDGQPMKILSIHLYESESTHTERYYLGNQMWITLDRTKGEKREINKR